MTLLEELSWGQKNDSFQGVETTLMFLRCTNTKIIIMIIFN
jgi:hypothetical protein